MMRLIKWMVPVVLLGCGADASSEPVEGTEGQSPAVQAPATGGKAPVTSPAGGDQPNTGAKPPSGKDTPAEPRPGAGQDVKPGKGEMEPKPVAAAPAGQALSNKPRVEDPRVSDGDRASLARGNRAFAFGLYGQLAGKDAGNLFFSPYSISSALAMTYAGARGQTAEQMKSSLKFELDGDALHAAFNATDRALTQKPAANPGERTEPFTLDVANALWAQQGKTFLPAYLDTLATHYGAGVELLDFATDPDGARETINGWVEDKTHDRIQDLLKPDDVRNETVFVLTNAIYFKATWQHDFEPSQTMDATFHAQSGDQTVKMMHGLITTSYVAGDGYQAVLLPYASSSSEMLVIVPEKGKLAALEGKLDEKLLDEIGSKAQTYMVTLALPRFRFEARFNLSETLMALGMKDAFTTGADFSGMDGGRDIMIDRVIHQALVAVDERGTEAAAATAVGGVLTSAPAPMPSVELTVDRPFVIAIRDRTQGDVLFLGRVASIEE